MRSRAERPCESAARRINAAIDEECKNLDEDSQAEFLGLVVDQCEQIKPGGFFDEESADCQDSLRGDWEAEG